MANRTHYSSRKSKRGKKQEWGSFILIGLSFFFLFVLIFPNLSGKFGEWIHDHMIHFSGWASLSIPLLIGHLGVGRFLQQNKIESWKQSLFYLSLLLFFACALAFFPLGNGPSQLGGSLGEWVYLFFTQQFGAPLTFLIALGVITISSIFLLKLSPLVLFHSLKERVLRDLSEWKEERKKIIEKRNLIKKLDQKSPQENKESLLSKMVQDSKLPPKISFPAKNKDMAPLLKKSESVLETNSDGTPKDPNPYLNYRIPEADLLTSSTENYEIDQDELMQNGALLEKTLEQFGVKAKVIDIHPGPVITRYDISPAPGTRVQSIETLSNDIALAMRARSLRVLAPVPGKAAVGIEISNAKPNSVYLKEIVSTSAFLNSTCSIPFGIGKTTEGEVYVTDLCSTPHLLIAGATGSGKSVSIHVLILSILYRFKPDQIKIMMIDPKRLELSLYDGIPHLYDPATDPADVRVITSPKDAVLSLKKLIQVMEERYKQFAKYGVRNIDGYNERALKENFPKAPYIIVIIDELADLMVTAGKEIEDLIQRLAQMARAVGIHLVLATQRPSVDVITGVIKANLPSRIAFQVLSKMDSRVILDVQGAETLLGKGDMLYLAAGAPRPIRLQGAFISEADVHRVMDFIRVQNCPPTYEMLMKESEDNSVLESEDNKRLLIRAAKVVRDTEKVSGDLLRADKEIGSRYDWALTLLKKKGLIEKPQDTNRWKIYFDRLGEFLAEVESREG